MDYAVHHDAEERRFDLIEDYRRGFVALIEHPVTLLVMGFAVCTLVAATWGMVSVPFIGGLMGFVFATLVSKPLAFGFAYVCLRAIRDDVAEPGDVVRVYDHYLEAAIAAALSTGFVLLGFAFLFVPGVFLLVRFAFVPYLVVEERMTAVDALFESYERTRGHGWTILGLGICRLILLGVGSLTFGLAVVPGAVWSELAMASLYERVGGGRPRAEY